MNCEVKLSLLDEEYTYAALAKDERWMNDVLSRKDQLQRERYEMLPVEQKEEIRRRAEQLMEEWDNVD